MMAAIAAWYLLIDSGTVSGGTVGGTADVITLTNSPTVGALAAGQRYLFVASGTNTTAVTLAVDGLTATAIRYKDVALVAGDIATGDYILCAYNGTRFQMLNPPRLSGAATDFATDTTGGAVADLFYFADASQSNASNKVTIQDMFNNVMTGLTADTAPDVADSLLTYDASGVAAKTTTITNFYKTINALTADATPDATADYVVTYDASASGAKKVLLNLATPAASSAQQVTGASAVVFTTPSVQNFHPSAAKFWASADVTTGVPTSGGDSSYNLTSFADTGVGRTTVTIAADFSTATWCALASLESPISGAWITGSCMFPPALEDGKAAGSCVLRSTEGDFGPQDPTSWSVAGFGAYA